MGIGDKIKERRLELGMSQLELAEQMGYSSKSTINKIELGKNDVSQSKVIKFANVLKTTPAYLMDWGEDTEYQENTEYLSTHYPNLVDLYNEIYSNDQLVLLFDKARKLEPQDLAQILKIIDTFNNETK